MKNMTKKHILYTQKPELYAICYMNDRTIYYNLAAAPKAKMHGMKGTRLYRIWVNMRQRTKNPNNHEYGDYGGRGIKLCKDWEKFENFCKWAKENGYAENLTIDRKDNEKGYSPDNCRWVTAKANNRNKRNNHCLAYKGETKTIAEWAEITGLSKAMIRYRVTKMGWSAERALETPKMRTRKQL